MDDEEKSVEDSEGSGYSYDNPADNAARKTAAGRRRQVRRESYKALLSHPKGRQLVYDILDHCGMFTDTNSTDPNTALCEKWRRSVGFFIQSDILLECGEEYTRMLKENLNG